MSHAHDHENTVPIPALKAAFALVAFSLVLTAAASFGFIDRAAVPQVEREKANVVAVASRELRFADREDGAVLISDVSSGDLIMVVEQETQSGGFVRGVLRGLARERRMHGIGSEPPFTLTSYADGSISLTDGATARRTSPVVF